MSSRAVAIGLKIPDNAAATALRVLQRLGVAVARLERSAIVLLDEQHDGAQVKGDPALFNPNLHRLTMLERATPRPGEVWVEETFAPPGARRFVGWRLFDTAGHPVARESVVMAAELLLANPAIERTLLPDEDPA